MWSMALAQLPPLLAPGSGGFTAAPLASLPNLDGRAWVAVEAGTGPATTIGARDGRFTVTLRETDQDTGDFARYEVWLQRRGAKAVRIDSGFSGWIYITPDSRYVFSEPLFVLDVGRMKQYALHDALGIPNYTTIEAISGDARRLLVSRRDCAMDCRNDQRVEYFELTLPR